MAKNKRVTLSCLLCGNMFDVYPCMANIRKFCSRNCVRQFQIGENNPNFGNKWSEEEKEIARNRTLENYSGEFGDYYREMAGLGNKGKIFSEERRKNMAQAHMGEKNHFYGKTHEEKVKEIIGEKSKKKFTNEFKEKYKKRMEDLGLWVKDSDREDKELYNILSEWDSHNWFTSIGSYLVEEYGIFNVKSNRTGCVRDHRYSRLDGHNNQIYPEILKHPANCEIMTHSKNSSKREKSSISIEELFKSIETYDGIYYNHQRVLELIKLWNSGIKFNIIEYRRNHVCTK